MQATLNLDAVQIAKLLKAKQLFDKCMIHIGGEQADLSSAIHVFLNLVNRALIIAPLRMRNVGLSLQKLKRCGVGSCSASQLSESQGDCAHVWQGW